MRQPSSRVTRRELGVALAAVPAAAALAQQSAPAEDLTAAAREQNRSNSETLRKFQIPTATEPSFAFRP